MATDPTKSATQQDPRGAVTTATNASASANASSGSSASASSATKDASEAEDFATLLAQYDASDTVRLQEGDKVSAKLIHVSGDTAFCAISATQEGCIPLDELTDAQGKLPLAIGDRFDAFVVSLRDGIMLRRRLGREHLDVAMLQAARESGMPVDGLVTGVNKGGLEVSIAGTRGFCPLGQIDLNFIEDATTLVGTTMQFAVREIKDRGRNLVLSRRVLLEKARREQAAKTLQSIEVGQRLRGKVSRILEFGVFVDLGGVDGLIPISELSYARVADPHEVVNEGDEVDVDVLRVEADPKRPDGPPRIALSLKATLPEPFEAHAHALHDDAVLAGRVVKIEKFGAFVELFPGVQGLVHVSELSHKRVRHPSDVVQVGEQVTVRVLARDEERRRLSLSIKQAQRDDAVGEPQTGTAGASGPGLQVGASVEGIVTRIEPFGIFVDLERGGSALLPAVETGTPRGADLARAFPIGSKHALTVLNIDERGRLRVSKRARDLADERALVEDYNRREGAAAAPQAGAGASGGGRSSGLGTLGDLLNAKKKR